MLNYCRVCNNNNMEKDSTLVGWNKEHCAAWSYTASITTLLFHTKNVPSWGAWLLYTDTVFFLHNGLDLVKYFIHIWVSKPLSSVTWVKTVVHELKVRSILKTLPECSLYNLVTFHIFWHKELDVSQFHLSVSFIFKITFVFFNCSCLCFRSSKLSI